jgi:hypothetical protein
LSPTVSKHGISALVQVSSLQQFFFHVVEHGFKSYLMDKLIGLCFEFLPHLHAVAFELPRRFPYMFSSGRMETAMANYSSPRTLQLRQLGAHNLGSIPEHISLPKLQVIKNIPGWGCGANRFFFLKIWTNCYPSTIEVMTTK